MKKDTDKKNQIENLIYSLDKSINILTTIDARDIHKESIPFVRCPRCNYGPIVIENCRDLMVKYGPGPSGNTSGLNQSAIQENKNKSDLRCPHCFFYSFGKSDWIRYGQGNWKFLPVVKEGLWEPLDCTDENTCYDITDANWKKKVGQPPPKMPCYPWSTNPGMSSNVNDNGWELPCDYKFNIRNRMKNATDLKEFLFKRKNIAILEDSFSVTQNVESIDKRQQETLRLIMQEISHTGTSTEKVLEALQQTGWPSVVTEGHFAVTELKQLENKIQIIQKIAQLYEHENSLIFKELNDTIERINAYLVVITNS
jgi:hypothetical protein